MEKISERVIRFRASSSFGEMMKRAAEDAGISVSSFARQAIEREIQRSKAKLVLDEAC